MNATVNIIRVKTKSGRELDLSEVIAKKLTEDGFVDQAPAYHIRENLESVMQIDADTWETGTGIRLTRV